MRKITEGRLAKLEKELIKEDCGPCCIALIGPQPDGTFLDEFNKKIYTRRDLDIMDKGKSKKTLKIFIGPRETNAQNERPTP